MSGYCFERQKLKQVIIHLFLIIFCFLLSIIIEGITLHVYSSFLNVFFLVNYSSLIININDKSGSIRDYE